MDTIYECILLSRMAQPVESSNLHEKSQLIIKRFVFSLRPVICTRVYEIVFFFPLYQKVTNDFGSNWKKFPQTGMLANLYYEI